MTQLGFKVCQNLLSKIAKGIVRFLIRFPSVPYPGGLNSSPTLGLFLLGFEKPAVNLLHTAPATHANAVSKIGGAIADAGCVGLGPNGKL